MDIDYEFIEYDNNNKIVNKIFNHMRIRWIYKEECFLLLKNAGFKNINVYGGFKFLKAKYKSELVWVATN